MKKIVLTLSGGMDSAVLLYKAAKEFDEIYAVIFDYGQRHNIEIAAAYKQIDNLAKISNVKVYEKVIDLKFLRDISPTSSLTNDDIDTPNVNEVMGEAQPKSYVPFRNMLFLSVLCSYAESVGSKDIWYGAAQADSLAGYWDGSEEFLEQINNITSLNREKRIKISAPLINMSKKDIIIEGVNLGVRFGDTYTCYSGNKICDSNTASSSLRLRGFIEAGYRDPLQYIQQDKLNRIYIEKNCKAID